MQRIVCPDVKSWIMVERLISVDVDGVGNVSGGASVVELGESVELDESVHVRPDGENNALGEETRDCCTVSMWEVLQLSSRRMMLREERELQE